MARKYKAADSAGRLTRARLVRMTSRFLDEEFAGLRLPV